MPHLTCLSATDESPCARQAARDPIWVSVAIPQIA